MSLYGFKFLLHYIFSATLVIEILPNFMGVLQNQFTGYCYNLVSEVSPNVVTKTRTPFNLSTAPRVKLQDLP